MLAVSENPQLKLRLGYVRRWEGPRQSNAPLIPTFQLPVYGDKKMTYAIALAP